MRTVDVTPTWTETVPSLIAILSRNPNNESALDHLYRMARLADDQTRFLLGSAK